MNDAITFIPPCCPNKHCKFYRASLYFVNPSDRPKGFCKLNGLSRPRADGSRIQRFRCHNCKRKFSDSTFKLNYRYQIRGHANARIFHASVHNRSNRSIARELGTSESLVRSRLLRLARVALLKHHHILESLQINEDLAYDGLENFAGSQFEPNYINQVVGSKTLFAYYFNFAPLNRKGRISPWQANKNTNIQRDKGRFDPKAVRICTKELLNHIANRISPSIEAVSLYTDNHYQYKYALAYDLKENVRSRFVHKTVSSKDCRNYKNILFPVNHLDVLIRRKSAAFARETICFSKKHSRMIHKYALYICYKNYMKPCFVKPHKSDPVADSWSPAMKLGIYARIQQFGDFFDRFHPSADETIMPLNWNDFYNDKTPFERSKKYMPKDKSKSLKPAA